MTALKYVDNRKNNVFTFGDLNIGDSFTLPGAEVEVPFIKTAIMHNKHNDHYNTVAFDGEFYWSDDDEEVRPIQEIEITIKK